MRAKCADSSAIRTRRRSKRWQRDSTVIGTLRSSVVAKTNFTCGGGSSSVFSSALKALRDSMWTSSMMKTLVRICHRPRAADLDDLAHVVDAGAGGGVHLEHVGFAFGQDGDAVGADAARVGGRAAGAVRADAVQRAGDDAGGGGLADAADAGEHEGMRDAAGGEGVAQDAHHRLLADQVVEAGRAVFPRQHPVRRGVHRPARRPAGSPNRPGPSGGGGASACGGSSWNRPDMRGGLQPPRRPPSFVAGKRWEAGQTTRAETHCGCFLPDLTGLARRPSAADLPGVHIMFRGIGGNRGCTPRSPGPPLSRG